MDIDQFVHLRLLEWLPEVFRITAGKYLRERREQSEREQKKTGNGTGMKKKGKATSCASD